MPQWKVASRSSDANIDVDSVASRDCIPARFYRLSQRHFLHALDTPHSTSLPAFLTQPLPLCPLSNNARFHFLPFLFPDILSYSSVISALSIYKLIARHAWA